MHHVVMYDIRPMFYCTRQHSVLYHVGESIVFSPKFVSLSLFEFFFWSHAVYKADHRSAIEDMTMHFVLHTVAIVKGGTTLSFLSLALDCSSCIVPRGVLSAISIPDQHSPFR